MIPAVSMLMESILMVAFGFLTIPSIMSEEREINYGKLEWLYSFILVIK